MHCAAVPSIIGKLTAGCSWSRYDKLKDIREVEHSLAGGLRCVLSPPGFLFSVAEADAPVKSCRPFGFQSSNMYSVLFCFSLMR